MKTIILFFLMSLVMFAQTHDVGQTNANVTSALEKALAQPDSNTVYREALLTKLTATDTASLSNRINLKLTATDTASLSNRINLKLTATDTASLSNRINLKLTATDTASLSNRIDAIETGGLDSADVSSLIEDSIDAHTVEVTEASGAVLLGNVGDGWYEATSAQARDTIKVNYVATHTITTDSTIAAALMYGGVFYVTEAQTITLPAVAVGMSATFITVGAVAVSIDVNASDLIYLDGTALADGDKATNTSTTGDIIVFTYFSAAGWYAASGSNDGDLWTDGN